MAARLQLEGTFTALVTPFTADGSAVDFDALKALVDRQVEAGVNCVPVGTTGECPTLSHEEHMAVIKCVVDQVAGRVKVIAGTGSNNTIEAISLTKHAKEVGADACLIVNPYYNKPTQEGLYQHFKKIGEECDQPIVLYNIPSRCGIIMDPATVARLYNDVPQIVAIKEATGSLDIAQQIKVACPEITILSGDDSLSLPLCSIGGKGVISVLSNIAPAAVKAAIDAALAGEYARAQELHLAMFPIMKTLFIEANPSPCKYAMSLRGECTDAVRLPLVPMGDDNKEIMRAAMEAQGYLA